MRPFAKHRLLSGLLALLVLAAAAAAVLGASHAAANQKPATLPVKAEPKTGITVYQNAKASVDASNLSEGYVMVRYTGGKQVRIKVLITGENGVTYTYNLNNTGVAGPSPSPRATAATPSRCTKTPPAPSTPWPSAPRWT